VKRWPWSSSLQEGALAVAAGLALYGASAGIETATGATPIMGAVVEETAKAALLLLAGWLGGRRPKACHPAQRPRAQALGMARGLSLGLVAITVFIGMENLAYCSAYPEAGILARLLWSLPVHLVAALVEALGALALLQQPEPPSPDRRWGRALRGPGAWFGALGCAAAWHGGANLLVSGRLPWPVFLAGAILATLLCLVLLSRFLTQAYLGGFLHGAD